MDRIDRESIVAVVNARRAFAATDNLILDLSMGGRCMGDTFSAPAPPPLTVSVRGAAPLARVDVTRSNPVVHSVPVSGANAKFTRSDREPQPGQIWFYIRA